MKYSSLALKLVFTGFCVAFSSNTESVCLSDFSVGKCVGSWLIQNYEIVLLLFDQSFLVIKHGQGYNFLGYQCLNWHDCTAEHTAHTEYGREMDEMNYSPRNNLLKIYHDVILTNKSCIFCILTTNSESKRN